MHDPPSSCLTSPRRRLSKYTMSLRSPMRMPFLIVLLLYAGPMPLCVVPVVCVCVCVRVSVCVCGGVSVD